jgi:hypothetical protein
VRKIEYDFWGNRGADAVSTAIHGGAAAVNAPISRAAFWRRLDGFVSDIEWNSMRPNNKMIAADT